MKPWQLVLAASLGLAAGPPLASPPPPPDVLRRTGETTLLSFRTAHGKTVSLCEGPHRAYLVYRFGTATKMELQYPAVLDASSWRKFTHFAYSRGGGAANAGMEDYRISFKNGAASYELYDRTQAVETEPGEEDYVRAVGLDVEVSHKILSIKGKENSTYGGLRLNDEERKRVKLAEDE